MGRVTKGVKCSVDGCDNQAIRSLSPQKVSSAGLTVEEGRRAYLCRDHYKDFRRSSIRKQAKRIEKWRYRT